MEKQSILFSQGGGGLHANITKSQVKGKFKPCYF